MDSLGILTALGSALCWGSFGVFFKKSKSLNLIQYQVITAIGIGLSGLIISLVFNFPLNLNIFALLSGAIWATADAIFLIALANIGLAWGGIIVSALVTLSEFIWGTMFFGELDKGFMNGLTGVGIIFLGISLVSMGGNTKSKNIKKGLLAATLSGLLWGSQLVPLKMAQIAGLSSFFPVCLGILITGLLIFLFSQKHFKNEAIGAGLLAGLIWNIGNVLSLISLSLIGLAKMGPISQSSALVAVSWGLFYFKEFTGAKKRLQVLMGALILFVGVVILGLA